MTKTYLAIAFLITGFLVGNAYGGGFPEMAKGEVYYCAETKSTGFHYDEKKKNYYGSNFEKIRFTIKVDEVSKTIQLSHDGDRRLFNCSPLIVAPLLFCIRTITGFQLQK